MTAKSKFRRPGVNSTVSGAAKEAEALRSLVCVVDDDSGIREALSSLLSSAGLRIEAFGSAEEFLRATANESPVCLILDLHLPDISGFDLQHQLAEADGPPIVFISGHGDIPSSVRAMKAGAIEFLPKPFSDQELLAAIDSAIAQRQKEQQTRKELSDLRKSYAGLSAREREVLPFIVAGLTNKQTAAKLGIVEITVQVHRAQIVRKMAARSIPDLVRMACKLGIS
jgi:FixJ family two-component response regulator